MNGILAMLIATALTIPSPDARTIVVGQDGESADLHTAIATAEDGDTIEVRGGVHHGPFVIEHAVELVGIDRPVLDGAGQGTVITFLVSGGRLSGFDVRNSGHKAIAEDSGLRAEGRIVIEDNRFTDVLYGINLKAARDSLVQRNIIEGRDVHLAVRGDGIRAWESHGSRLLDNHVSGVRDVVIWYSRDLEIRGNVIRESRYGLHYMYSHGGHIADNRMERNSVGAYLMYSTDLVVERNLLAGNHGPSGYGLAFKDSDEVSVLDNVMAGNRVGLYLDNTPSRMEVTNAIRGNTLAYNDIGTLMMPAVKRNDFAANSFIDNLQHVALTAGGDAMGNEWTPGGVGNFWSGYAGFDADGDGHGDIPFRAINLFDDLMERRPAMRLFALGPAQLTIDFAARAFPIFQPPPLLVDEAPLMAPPTPGVPPPPADVRPLTALTATMVALALAVVGWGATMDGLPRTSWRRLRGAHATGALQ